MSRNDSILIFLFAYFGVFFLIAFISFVLKTIAFWRLFTKAGEKGWKSLIPIYSEYIFFRLVWDTKYYWILLGAGFTIGIMNGIVSDMNSGLASIFISLMMLGISICTLWIQWHLSQHTAKSFGKGKGFGVGLFFLSGIFRLIIGFDDSQYLGKTE